MASARTKQRTGREIHCSSCESEQVIVISKWRYIIMTAIWPLLITLAIGVLFHLLFLLFIPALIWMNIMVAKRKAPLVICRACRHTSVVSASG
ncbi:hypothetical protein [Texcoconibacillus texcoconensis]|uniref:Uncharacterized protein n=1 Tax=Texcoconibacillus texcoconensis TaxID=1095777 RepID=A0A840QM15_9BACI|nr:hypothetical protein [Texcoconibacillus texcoconensis]MBB5172381.1 hypothetical protein [Texcoconibacillus texcoconensis]